MATTSIIPSFDTFIRGGVTWQSSNFDNQGLAVKEGSIGFTRVSVLKFDLSGLPGGATVNAVTLDGTHSVAGDNSGTAYVFEGLRDWNDTGATWLIYSTGNSWGSDGCRGEGTDMVGKYATGSGNVSAYNIPGNQSVDDTFSFPDGASFRSLVESSIGSTLNLVLHQHTGNDANFFFYDSQDAAKEPTLEVDYTAAAGTDVGQMTPNSFFWGGVEA